MTTQTDLDVASHKVVHDERVKERNRVQRLFIRPEMGAAIGAVAIFVFFLIVAPPFRSPEALATVLYASSTIGIMACAVALLMIGGEFDLSSGVAVTTSSLAASMLAYNLHLNLWAGAGLALIVALAVGFFNGYLVMKTKIPSFLITLGTLLMLTGINLAVTKLISGQVATPSVNDMAGWASAQKVFSSSFTIAGVSIRITVLWWLLFTAVATYVLFKTRIGNWIFAVGGDQESARAVGVPVTAVKVGLFMFVGFCAWFAGMHLLFAFNTVQSGQGVGNEFIYIIAAVIGGCLLTGGYGTAIGAAIGAFIFGMVQQGIVYAGWNPDWFKFFMGVMLLFAVIANNASATTPRRGDPMTATVDHKVDEAPSGGKVPLVELKNVGKSYGNITALNGISLRVHAGEVTGILGDNGAGKSTLIKIISGLHQQSEGELLVDGQPTKFGSPKEALGKGIATVYQNLAVVPLMPVWRNFFLGQEIRKKSFPFSLDANAMRATTLSELHKMGIDLPDVDVAIGSLSGGQRQCVAIARAVFFGARVLILDEPTAALGVKQSGVVLKYITAAKDAGFGVVFITHNPHHAHMVGDHFVLLNRGKQKLDCTYDEIDLEHLTQEMAGGDELAALSHELRGKGA